MPRAGPIGIWGPEARRAECLEIKVTGAREIEKILKELGPTAANRIARSALNRSATPIVRRAKELVPVATGELKRATTRRQRLWRVQRRLGRPMIARWSAKLLAMLWPEMNAAFLTWGGENSRPPTAACHPVVERGLTFSVLENIRSQKYFAH